MKNLIHLYRDPDPVEEGGGKSIYESIMEAPDAPVDDKTVDINTPPADKVNDDKAAKKFAWGDEDRRKTRAEIKDEDEIDLGYEREVEGKKSPAKATMKEIKEAAKFLNDNNNVINSALGMRDQFSKNPDLKKAFNAFWGKAFEGNKYNPEYVGKLNAFLDGKQEEVKDKIDDQTDDIKEMEKDLAELDEASPQAKVLKRNISAIKATRTQLTDALKTIKTLQEKTDEHGKFRTNFEDTQKKDKESKEAEDATKLFDDTLGALRPEKKYVLEDPDDEKEFIGGTKNDSNGVKDYVANLAQNGRIKNDDEFKKAIADCAKVVFDRINKRNERIITGYLKKKGGVLPKKDEKEVKDEKTTPDEKSIGQFFADNMSNSE